jgi:ABC-type multidrug transport system fused ATPase/permease subunit
MTHRLLDVASPRQAWDVTRGLLARRRAPLAWSALAFCVTGLAQLVAPWLMGRTVDVVLDGGPSSQITRYAIAIAVAAVVAGAAGAVAQGQLARAGEPALAELREEVVDRVLHLPHARVEEAGVGDLLSRVGDDVRAIGRSLEVVVPTMLGSGIAVVFTLGALVALDVRLGLAGLVALPAYVLALRWYLPRSAPYYRRERIAQGERAEALVTGVQSVDTLTAYRLERRQLDRTRDASMAALTITLDVWTLLTRFFARNNRAECIGLLAVLATGFLLVRDDAASVGEVTAAALFFHRIFNPIGILVTLFDEVQSAGASMSRLAGVVLLPATPPRTQAPVPLGPLTVEGLTHEYVAGTPVVRNVDLTIEPGERVALVGSTGAGKTTVGAVVAGLLPPTCGQVRLGGTPYEQLDRATLRERVVLVSQDVHVFSGTVREAVTLVAPAATDGEVEQALRTVLAWEWVQALPQGLETQVGEHGHPLTPLQAQQLALARVSLLDPDVVVLDEATAEAGSSGARELELAAAAVTEGRGALVIAHRLSQSAAADRVLVMEHGRVVEQGSHDELVAAGGRYAALWRAWSSTGSPAGSDY